MPIAPPDTPWVYRGTLASTGAFAVEPAAQYYFTSGSHHRGYLVGDAPVNMQLHMWTGTLWSKVAEARGAHSDLVYDTGAPGFYAWTLQSLDGAIDYTFWLDL